MAPDEAARLVMPWGKYKGKSLYDVPVEYLDWLQDQTFMKAKNNARLLDAILIHLEHDRAAEWDALADD